MGFLKNVQNANPDNGVENEIDPSVSDELPPDDGQQGGADGGRRGGRFKKMGQTASPLEADDHALNDAAKTDSDKEELAAESANPPDFSAVLYVLRELLQKHDWDYAQSGDAKGIKKGAEERGVIEYIVRAAIASGHKSEVESLFDRHAPGGKAALDAFLNQEPRALPDEETAFVKHDIVEVEKAVPDVYIPLYSPEDGIHHDSAGRVFDAEWFGSPPHFDIARRSGEAFSDEYKKPEWPPRPMASANPEEPDDPERPMKHGASDPLSKILSMPFAVTAAAGSLVVNSLRAAGGTAKSFYVKQRVNGHHVLGSQLDQKAAEIQSLANSLKRQGMGDLINHMKSTGRPAREIFSGMAPGGPHQHFSDRFDALMANPGFAEKYAKLESSLHEFGVKAARYAESGVELNVDFSDVIDRNLETIAASTEGFVFKRDGVIEHLQELASQIAERISNLVNNLFQRLSPR